MEAAAEISGGCILRGRDVGGSPVGHFFADGAPPFEPADGIVEGANFALLGTVECLDGQKFNSVTGLEEANDEFGLDFEMVGSELEAGPGVEIDHAEAALRIGQRGIAKSPEFAAHPAVHSAAEEGHGLGSAHTVADDHGGGGFFGAREEGRNVRWGVLAIAIHGEGPTEAALQSGGKAGGEGGAFAAGGRVRKDFGTGALGEGGGMIGRAIINHEDSREVTPDVPHQIIDAVPFIQTGNDNSNLFGPTHGRLETKGNGRGRKFLQGRKGLEWKWQFRRS